MIELLNLLYYVGGGLVLILIVLLLAKVVALGPRNDPPYTEHHSYDSGQGRFEQARTGRGRQKNKVVVHMSDAQLRDEDVRYTVGHMLGKNLDNFEYHVHPDGKRR